MGLTPPLPLPPSPLLQCRPRELPRGINTALNWLVRFNCFDASDTLPLMYISMYVGARARVYTSSGRRDEYNVKGINAAAREIHLLFDTV